MAQHDTMKRANHIQVCCTGGSWIRQRPALVVVVECELIMSSIDVCVRIGPDEGGRCLDVLRY